MKILIVDDQEVKCKKIESLITASNNNFEIVIKSNYQDTIKYLKESEKVDLMILDMNLPIRTGEETKKNGGLNILNEIIRNNYVTKPEAIIGLTAFKDIENKYKLIFENEGWVLAFYESSADSWEKLILNKLNYLGVRQTDGKSEIISDNWGLMSIIIGLVLGVLVYIICNNLTVSVATTLLAFVFFILKNPRRRFYRAAMMFGGISFANQLPYLEYQFYGNNQYLKFGYPEQPTISISISLGVLAVSGFLFYLDYKN